jgi:hypothetical protein
MVFYFFLQIDCSLFSWNFHSHEKLERLSQMDKKHFFGYLFLSFIHFEDI